MTFVYKIQDEIISMEIIAPKLVDVDPQRKQKVKIALSIAECVLDF